MSAHNDFARRSAKAVACSVAALCAVISVFLFVTPVAAVAAPFMTVSPASELEFGEVGIGQTAVQHLTVANSGADDLIIQQYTFAEQRLHPRISAVARDCAARRQCRPCGPVRANPRAHLLLSVQFAHQ